MFDKIKNHPYFQKLKEIWKNPRYHALIILGCYFVFFILVISYIRTMNSSSEVITKPPLVQVIDQYRFTDNYEFEISMTKDSNAIRGKRFYGEKVIQYGNKEYYQQNGKLYQKIDGKYVLSTDKITKYNILLYTPSNIYLLIQKGKLNSEATSTNGVVTKEYLVDVSYLINLYHQTENNIPSNELFQITTTEVSGKIVGVRLDITKYAAMEQYYEGGNCIIEIKYQGFGTVSNLGVVLEESKYDNNPS